VLGQPYAGTSYAASALRAGGAGTRGPSANLAAAASAARPST